MSTGWLVYALLLPLVFWAAYHYYHDRARPEPVGNLVLTLGLGVLASLLAGLGYRLPGLLGWQVDVLGLAETDLPALAAYAVLGIGLIEELAKMLPFVLVVIRFRDFDEPFDGIVYASFLALGFALAETWVYGDRLGAVEAFARGFAGPVVHIVFASVWGHHIGLAALTGRRVVPVALVWLVVTATLHGAYDVIVLAFSDSALIAASLLILGIWLWRLRIIWRVRPEHP